MFLTAAELTNLGIKQCVGLNTPTALINGVAVSAKYLTYNSLDEVKLTEWFIDHSVSGTLIVCDTCTMPDCDKVVVRLYDIRDMNGRGYHGDGEFSPLWAHRKTS